MSVEQLKAFSVCSRFGYETQVASVRMVYECLPTVNKLFCQSILSLIFILFHRPLNLFGSLCICECVCVCLLYTNIQTEASQVTLSMFFSENAGSHQEETNRASDESE